jgi:hypothetical protein
MGKNIGTIITAAVRPNDSLDLIATAFSSEIKGGLHTVQDTTSRDAIYKVRREWGMLCYVVDDLKTYQLIYGYVDGDISNNLNWKEFSSGSGSGSEWLDSLISKQSSDPVSPSIGDRYLVTSVASGLWAGQEDKVAEWTPSLFWTFTTPKNGMSVRIDNEDNSIYRYEGTYSTGIWVKELVSQVRYINATSIDGVYFTGNTTPLIDNYISDILYLTIFATESSSGSASLNINSLGDVLIKKPTGVGLTDILSGDIKSGVVYSIYYDGTYFQINIPSDSLSSGIIGPAEDGDYTDGLFTDFTPNTPIGTPIDRFNEILKALVPPPAPSLSDWSGSKSGTLANGKLSFDGTYSLPGYSNASNAPSPIYVDGLWSASGKRLAISPQNGGDITGILNYQVPVHGSLPNPSYATYSFSDANVGFLRMYINGSEFVSSTVNLFNISSSSVSGTSGFNLSAATSSKFPEGSPFDNFWNRTGTWILKNNLVTNGYNYVYIVHDNATASTGSFSRVLNRFEFIVDDDTTPTSISSPVISSYAFTGNKMISGISYYTGGSVRYDVSVDHLYRNTYYPLSNAISFSDQSGGTTAPILTTTATLALAPCGGTESKQFKISNNDQNGSSLTFSLISSSKRRNFEPVGVGVTCRRTVQATTSGGVALVNNVLLDSFATSSTNYLENFDYEKYRLKNTYVGLTYDTYSTILSNVWNSSQSLIIPTAGWNDGLQVSNGKLIYPKTDYSTISDLTTNLNFGNTLTDYSTSTGDRVYIRYFYQLSPTTGNFKVVINGSSGTFVSIGTPLVSNNIHFEIKAPGLSSTETGWLDAYSDFANGVWSDGSGGRDATAGIGRAFGVNWGLTIGTKNTANTGGYILIRITVASTFVGEIDSINWTFS